MAKLILTRHGQSVWNAENRFTGWVDVDLSDKGIQEAEKSGQLIRDLKIRIDVSYTSYLKRAIKTLTTILKTKIYISNEKDLLLDTGGGVIEATTQFKDSPFFVINPDTLWSKKYLEEVKKLEETFYKYNKQ